MKSKFLDNRRREEALALELEERERMARAPKHASLNVAEENPKDLDFSLLSVEQAKRMAESLYETISYYEAAGGGEEIALNKMKRHIENIIEIYPEVEEFLENTEGTRPGAPMA